MIDGTMLMITGVVVQAAVPARALFAALQPGLRGPGLLASIAFTSIPHSTPASHALAASIVAPTNIRR